MIKKLPRTILVVYDFDGVMTDNKVYVDQNGCEMVQVSRADGLSISEIRKLGLKQIIISTEKNTVVSARSKKLEIPCLQGVEDKKKVLIDYCNKNDVNLKNVTYVGNDINDLEVMEIVGTRCCPADAHEDIKKISDIICSKNGGDGVIRELLDYLTNGQLKYG